MYVSDGSAFGLKGTMHEASFMFYTRERSYKIYL